MVVNYPYQQEPRYKELDFTQAGAVQNTWYTAFEGNNVEFVGVAGGITVADETVELRLTLDGVLISSSAGVACAFAGNFVTLLPSSLRCTSGQAVFIQNAAVGNVDIGSFAATTPRTDWLKGHRVKIEIRKTTNAGASALRCIGVYHQW